MADAFMDRIKSSYNNLKENELAANRLHVPEEMMFDGFDCCENLVQSGVDVVLLATPPYFRPAHLTACVNAGKHVFCEKPVAVDPPGVRDVLAACQVASEKRAKHRFGLVLEIRYRRQRGDGQDSW